MAPSDIRFSGSIPENYDRYMVPMLFEQYAADIAARAARLAPTDVLETAAGTGVVTRALAGALPATARIHATDLNPGMLALASSALASSALASSALASSALTSSALAQTSPTHHPHITFAAADAQALPNPDHSLDLVVCQFGVMFFPDKPKAFAQACRVLRPGGAFLFSVWDGLAENAFIQTVSAALAGLFPANPPSLAGRIPHGYHDMALIRSQLVAAGFTAITTTAVPGMARAATPLDAAMAFCQGTPMRTEIEACGPPGIDMATAAAAAALASRFGPGPIEGPILAHVICATR